MTAPAQLDIAALRDRLSGVPLRDEARLGSRLDRAARTRNRAARQKALDDLARRIERGEQQVARRAAAVPDIRYPDLPVSAVRAELADAIKQHQVIVVAGETGSGKTTQLPKICLELGLGVRGTIGHTQPRRLAARTVAQRIADELATPLGDIVGYTVRFADEVSDRTMVRLMTDGILLAEIQRDPLLLRYDTLIVDEAHERSLNIDFILGYLVRLLPRRPDLKVIVTSATINPQQFADHFGGAPVIEVSGRTYPVEIRYRPLDPTALDPEALAPSIERPTDDPELDDVRDAGVRDQTEGIVDAVRELQAEGPGDVLVFLSGEREIRDTAEALRGLRLPDTEVLPLYARQASADQLKVFSPHAGGRRIVLSTNVAETSLTVPGIRYVIDTGTARISRYSRRTKVQRLPIEAISQASATQRTGRCGRVAAGVCIRLYSAQDFAARPAFTDPEILRTNLASVILQMAAAGLGDIADFPFLDAPDRRSVRDGIAVLQELGALDADELLTPLGRRLAQLPVDPRLARMIVQGADEGCLREVIVLVAALSIPDPRDRPADHLAAADQLHARFRDEQSDFVTFLNLWNHLRELREGRSGNQFRRACRDEFLNYLRVREWQDLAGQLRAIARSIDLVENDEPAPPARVHVAMLSGLLSHIGMRTADSREYLGARGVRFVLSPGSVLARRPPRWVVAAELVETSRLYARVSTRIEPESVERLAGHLVVRTYSEPHWDARRGAAMTYERVTLYGLPVVARRRVQLSQVDAALARELFLRHALVEGDWQSSHRFLADNRAVLAEAAEFAERTRRPDLEVDDERVFAFYDARIPGDVVSARHFDAWWKHARRRDPALLSFSLDDVLPEDAQTLGEGHPDTWRTGELELRVSYRFQPGAPDDGVTVHVPLEVLARVDPERFSWQVPALREELVVALLRALPKQLRRAFVPIPDTVRAVLAELGPSPDQALLPAVQRALHRRTGVLVPIDAFDLTRVPSNLLVGFAVEDASGEVLARGKDLAALQRALAESAQAAVGAAVAPGLRGDDLRDWPDDLDELPRVVEEPHGGQLVRGFPTLIDAGDAACLRVLASPDGQDAAMRAGVRRLLRTSLPSPQRTALSALGPRDRLLLAGRSGVDGPVLAADCADAAADDLMGGAVPWTRAGFAALRDRVGPALPARTRDLVVAAVQVLAVAHDVRAGLPERPTPAQDAAVTDIRGQLDRLVGPGFVARAGAGRLPDLRRYLTAARIRLEKLPRELETDTARMQRVQLVEQAYRDLVAALPEPRRQAPDVVDIAWLLEELRVSLWAQQLGTARSVSEQRIYRVIDSVAP